MYAWGKNDYGQLGIGNTTDQLEPAKIQGLNEVREVFTYSTYVYALTENGDLYAWGRNDYGQVGIRNESEEVKVVSKPLCLNKIEGIGFYGKKIGFTYNIGGVKVNKYIITTDEKCYVSYCNM